MAMMPMEYKEIKSESFSASMKSGAALLYSGANRVVVAVETTDVPFVVGIERSGNNWYVNCAKLSTGTPRYYIAPDNATITGTYYYLDV